MAAKGFATEIMEVKAAINRVVVPVKYDVNISPWLKKSSNIRSKRYEIVETSLTVFTNEVRFSNVKLNLRFTFQF
jgi:hypothetical protein